MSVYVDSMRAKFGRMVMCHMLADTTEELLAMADTIGVSRRWIQDAGTIHEHFDIALSKRSLAVKAGAIEIDAHDVGDILSQRRRRADLSEVQAPDPGALPPGVHTDIETVRSLDTAPGTDPAHEAMRVRRWWLSTQAMTIEIETQAQIVTKAPPIARKFIGLRSVKLVQWMRLQPGPLRIEDSPHKGSDRLLVCAPPGWACPPAFTRGRPLGPDQGRGSSARLACPPHSPATVAGPVRSAA